MEKFIQWRNEWLLGIDVLDNQHRALADQLNRLVQECSCGKESGQQDNEQRRKKLASMVDELYTQTRQHFSDEEAMMLKQGYPGYKAHAREHTMLLAELKSTFAASFEQGCCNMEPAVMKALRSWFIVHIVRSDREFADHVFRTGIREQSPAGPEQ